MKKFLPGILFVIFCLSVANAQDDADWRAFHSPREEFSVEFPAPFSSRSFSGVKEDLPGSFYMSFFGKTYYIIRTGNEKNKPIFDAIRNYILSNQAANGAEIIGGLNASVYTFQDADGYFNRILEIKFKRRTYFFHTLSETENSPNVARFFDSIVIGDKTEKHALAPDEKTGSTEKTDKIKAPVPTPGSVEERGVGTGDGSGLGNGSGDAESGKPEATAQISPLKILSKPRVSYTELARQYMITGKVRLRVTFLQNGQIGDVVPLSRLPFGLTRNAVEVARQIRFEPATRNGLPYAVRKIIEYNFNIY